MEQIVLFSDTLAVNARCIQAITAEYNGQQYVLRMATESAFENVMKTVYCYNLGKILTRKPEDDAIIRHWIIRHAMNYIKDSDRILDETARSLTGYVEAKTKHLFDNI